jgi:hypothetical protein
MADVLIRARLDEDIREMIANALPGVIFRALEKAKDKIIAYSLEIMPWRTGRLAKSIYVTVSENTVSMEWDPVDPVSGFHYAKVVDIGRPGGTIIEPLGDYPLHFFWERMGGIEMYRWSVKQGPMTPARYSDHMRIVAPQFVREAIIDELQTIGS